MVLILLRSAYTNLLFLVLVLVFDIFLPSIGEGSIFFFILMMLLRPIPTAIIATVANDHRVYVHSLSGALLLLLLLLSVDNNDYDTSIVMLLWPSRSIITGSSLIGEDFAIAYAFTPSLLLLLLLHCDRDCFCNNDDSFNDTDTSTYYELRPQQRRFFFVDTVTDTSTYYDGRTNDVCCCWWWSYYYPIATVANNPTVYAYLPSSTPIQILIRFVSIDSVSTVIMIIPVPTDVVSSYFKLISIHIWWSYVFDYGTGRVLHSLRLHGTIKS